MTDSEALIRTDQIERLRSFGGERLVRGILDLFLRTGPERVETVVAAVRQEDWSQVAYVCHSLRSSARIVGADGLEHSCQEIETAAGRRDKEEVRRLVPEFQARMDHAVRRLEELRRPGEDNETELGRGG